MVGKEQKDVIPIKKAPRSHDFNSFFQPFAGNKKGHHRLQGLDSGTDKSFSEPWDKMKEKWNIKSATIGDDSTL